MSIHHSFFCWTLKDSTPTFLFLSAILFPLQLPLLERFILSITLFRVFISFKNLWNLSTCFFTFYKLKFSILEWLQWARFPIFLLILSAHNYIHPGVVSIMLCSVDWIHNFCLTNCFYVFFIILKQESQGPNC